MKKLVALLLALLVAASFVACGFREPTQTEETTVALEIGQDGYSGSSFEGSSNYDPAMEVYESAFLDKLGGEVLCENDSIAITCKTNLFDVGITLECPENITYFGNYVVAVKNAFESVFDESQRGIIAISLRDGGDSVVSYFSTDVGSQTAGDYGLITDYRSGTIRHIPLDTVDDLCNLFPTTIAYIGKSEINADDLAIYEEVMDILNSDFSRSEDEILEEVAPNYGMTTAELKQFLTDIMLKIYGFSNNITQTTDEQPNAIYPLNIDDAYLDCADSLPDIIYTTPASENGLDGNIYTFVGTIKEIITYSNDDYLYDAAFVKTEKGTVIITNLYKAIYDSVASSQGENAAKTVLSDEITDYIFPEIGETAQFVVIYSGYSSVYEMPAFYLGASSNFFELIGCEDPANS